MLFYAKDELEDDYRQIMKDYDSFIRNNIGDSYNYPIRMRNWELYQILKRIPKDKKSTCILDTGSCNTFFGLWLSEYSDSVTISDIYKERIYKNILRRIGILTKKENEAPIEKWYFTIKKASNKIKIKSVDLTAMNYADNHFDYITSISVIEHIPDVEKAISEMYRCIKPGGKLMITTDCSPDGNAYADGVRYFKHEELSKIFKKYPLTSPFNQPDFCEENWCYKKDKPVLTVFIEITKK